MHPVRPPGHTAGTTVLLGIPKRLVATSQTFKHIYFKKKGNFSLNIQYPRAMILLCYALSRRFTENWRGLWGVSKLNWSLLFFSPDLQAPSQSDFPTSAVKGDRHNYSRHTSKPSATRQKTGFPGIICQVLRRPFLDSKESSISSLQLKTPRSLVQDAVGSQVCPEAPGSGGAPAGLGPVTQGPPAFTFPHKLSR